METVISQIKQEVDSTWEDTTLSPEFVLTHIKTETGQWDSSPRTRIKNRISIKHEPDTGDMCQHVKLECGRENGETCEQRNTSSPIAAKGKQKQTAAPPIDRKTQSIERRRSSLSSDIRSYFLPKKSSGEGDTEWSHEQPKDNASTARFASGYDLQISQEDERNSNLNHIDSPNDMVFVELIFHTPESLLSKRNGRKRKRLHSDSDTNTHRDYFQEIDANEKLWNTSITTVNHGQGKQTKYSKPPEVREKNITAPDKQQIVPSPEEELKFKCTTCTESFSTLMKLNAHKRAHRKSKPYLCRLCGMRFCKKSNLLVHTEFHSKQSLKS